MIPLFDRQFFLLAKGGWTELIGFIVVVGIYALGAAAKIWANRSKTNDEENAETSPAIELAKKYTKQRQLKQQTRPVSAKRNEFVDRK